MLKNEDIAGFFAEGAKLNLEDYLQIDYTFETAHDPRLAAALVCCEQSTAQWKRDGVNEDLRPRFGAKVLFLEVLSRSRGVSSVRARIAHPIVNFGSRIPNLLAAIAGEGAFYCPGVSTIRIMDLHFPESYLKTFQGPQFGLKGLRDLLQVRDRPFFIGVVKPNIGLSPEEFSELAYQSWLGGLDIAKDDEMLAECDYSPIAERMRLSGQARRKAEAQTGVPKMLLANITDEVDLVEQRYREASEAGANSVMLDGMFTGLSAIRALRKYSQIPITGHFTGMALYDRTPNYGIDGVPLVKLQRLAGCDLIVLPGFGPRMYQSDEMVLRNVKACLEPMGPIPAALPVPGGSDSAKTLHDVFKKIGHADFGFIAGRGVFGYPGGPKAGAESLHEAWKRLA